MKCSGPGSTAASFPFLAPPHGELLPYGAQSDPRSIWLACLGWELTRLKSRMLPLELPTAREYAAAHA